MPRYRSTLSERELNYTDSGGPVVAPGAVFEHVIPAAQLASHLRSGFIVPAAGAAVALIDEPHAHPDRAVVDRRKFGGAPDRTT